MPPELGKVYRLTINELRGQINAKNVEYSETGTVIKKNDEEYTVSGRCAIRENGRMWLYLFTAEVICYGHVFAVNDVKYERK